MNTSSGLALWPTENKAVLQEEIWNLFCHGRYGNRKDYIRFLDEKSIPLFYKRHK